MIKMNKFVQNTSDFIKGLGDTHDQRKDALIDLFSNVTVYDGFGSSNTANGILSVFPNTKDLNPDGVTAGNNIYLKDIIGTLGPKKTAELIGHEAIHSIQAAAAGKMAFVNYSVNMPYSDRNIYELTAYTFSGTNSDRFSKINSSNFSNIFDNDKKNKNWWEL